MPFQPEEEQKASIPSVALANLHAVRVLEHEALLAFLHDVLERRHAVRSEPVGEDAVDRLRPPVREGEQQQRRLIAQHRGAPPALALVERRDGLGREDVRAVHGRAVGLVHRPQHLRAAPDEDDLARDAFVVLEHAVNVRLDAVLELADLRLGDRRRVHRPRPREGLLQLEAREELGVADAPPFDNLLELRHVLREDGAPHARVVVAELLARLHAQAKVKQDDLLLPRPRRVLADHHVRRVRVGMHEALAEQALAVRLHERLHRRLGVELALDALHLDHLHRVDPLGDEHPPSAVVAVQPGDVQVGAPGPHLAPQVRVVCLDGEVHLAVEVLADRVHAPRELDPEGVLEAVADDIVHREVPPHLVRDARLEHLDRYVLHRAVSEADLRPVNLRDGRGGDRRLVELDEGLMRRPPEVLGDDAHDLVRRRRRRLVQQHLQALRVLRREHVVER
mmetsp:Transcript_23858/g.73917  ORF Transcript_23858/g.73917 Transcript_23858/m.73917 type:complete len:451 (-) Transcript_23858:461-1813(-)